MVQLNDQQLIDIFPNLGQKARSQVYEKRLQVIERTKPIAKLPRKFDPNYKIHKITIMTDTQTEESQNQQTPNKIENSQDNLVNPEDNSTNVGNLKPEEKTDIFNESLESMKEMFSSLEKSMSSLQKDFDIKIKDDKSKDTTIDSLHRELETYREDLAFKLLRPLVLELTRITDQMRLLSAKYREENQTSEAAEFAEELDNCILDIQEAISSHDFEFFQVEGSIFDGSQQKVQETRNTDESELDKQIAKRIRVGLRYKEKVVRPELVTVYRYVPSKPEEPGT